MKRIGKWLLGLITSALTLVLVIVLLPYAAKWVARIMPDESAAAIRASVVLSQKLEQSAKLETLHVTEEGALNYEVKAAFLGTVASINADYTYEGSFGIDLQQVTMTRDGSVLTLTLPAPELPLVPSVGAPPLPTDDLGEDGHSLHDVTLNAMAQMLRLHKGNVSAAAKALGVSRNTIYRKKNLLPPDLLD